MTEDLVFETSYHIKYCGEAALTFSLSLSVLLSSSCFFFLALSLHINSATFETHQSYI
jgi:hypothetical protein